MASSVTQTLARLDVFPQIAKAAAWCRTLRGRKRLVIAGGMGAVSALAYAPFYLWPLLLLTLPALVWMIDGTGDARRPWLAAALVAWAFGAGYFLIGLHWIGFAFAVDVERHLWQLPFAAVLMPSGLALFFGAAAGLARLRWSRGTARIVLLAASLAAFEWLRGHVLTGFPWNLPGYVWSGWDAMFQTASLYGIYGLSLVTLLIVFAPAALVDRDGSSGVRWPIAAALAAFVVLLTFGLVRLPAGAAPLVENVALRIVQPNVPQSEKWRAELLERNWRLLLDLTRRPGLETRTHVIWPEAAPPFFLLQEPVALQVIAQVLPDNATLLSGTVRTQESEGDRAYFNSMAAISGTGTVLGFYDKAHLVPFGEYLPLYRVLEPLGFTKITGQMSEGYREGEGVRTLSVPKTPPFGPLICYEVIFPGEVVAAGKRPDWLVNMTDDSWFGPWTGPYQHLGIAKVRAAEEGLPIVRAANTGVSAVLDPYGRTVTSLGLDITGILDSTLPKPLNPTLFARLGDVLFGIMLLLCVGLGVFFYRPT